MRKLLCSLAVLFFAISLTIAAPAAPAPSTPAAKAKPANPAASKPAASPPAKKATADPKAIKPYVDAGDVIVNAGLGYAGYYGGFGAAAGLEYDFFKVNAGALPVTFGAAARGAFQFGGYIDTVWCAGAMATAHLGLRGVKIPTSYGWASNLDTYIGVGIGLAGGNDSYWKVTTGVGPSFIVGETYYFNDRLGVNFEYGYIGGYDYSGYYSYKEYAYYASLGIVYKL